MKVRWLGWAGVELEAEGATLVIDPLADPAATFAALGDRAAGTQLPDVVAPAAQGTAVAGLVSHLHRDHTDAPALAAALAPGAAVHEPQMFAGPGGEDVENLSLAQANFELGKEGLERRSIETWGEAEAGPFKLTALPAVDGLGDPQVSWLVEADGVKVLHLGDTILHSYWWRMARRHGPFDVVFAPINGAVIDFPHLQPPRPDAAAMEPEQAALSGEILRARNVVPMHYGGFEIEPFYKPVENAPQRFAAAASDRGYEVRALEPGGSFEPEPAPVATAST